MSDKVPSMEALPFRARCGSDFRVYQHCHLCSAARSQGTICLCVPSALNVVYTSGVSCFTRETSAVSESHWIQKQIFQYHISTRGQNIPIPPQIMSRDQKAGRSHSMKIDNSCIERVEEFKYLGATLTSKNSIQEEIKSRLKVGMLAIIQCRIFCLPVCYPKT